MREFPMPELRVLLMSDGRPGHFNLSEGIVAAMARRRPVRVERLEVKRRRIMSGRLAAGLLAIRLPPATILGLAHGLEPDAIPQVDVIVSAGAETMPANVALARLRGVPNVFYGSLRAFQPSWFELVLTSYSSQARHPHPVMTLKPNRLDPDGLPPLLHRDPLTYTPRRAGLLIGGDGGGTRFADADWNGLLALLAATHAAWGARWIVANSRRTPEFISNKVATLASGGQAVERFVDVRDAGAGTLTALLADAELIAVTADSSSMVSEAVWSRRPVLALAPAVHEMTPMEADYRAWLEADARCCTLPIAGATPDRMLAAMAGIAPLNGNPLEDLASLLAVRLPGVLA